MSIFPLLVKYRKLNEQRNKIGLTIPSSNINKPASRYERIFKKLFSYFPTKTCLVGTQKNRLRETYIWSTKTI